ncbi:hypothetical protein HDU85_002764 [Gaertneriomyces sp. JEL0708]|nr:hypothetical protein HDU85_002764 [Gaertneriomyces sp. JEL0708]
MSVRRVLVMAGRYCPSVKLTTRQPGRLHFRFYNTNASAEGFLESPQATERFAFKDEENYAELRSLDNIDANRDIAFQPFPDSAREVLGKELNVADVEIKPDGQPYLPEIKYRRVLNAAFGPGGWGMIPRTPHTLAHKTLSREYALYALGRYVSSARGSQQLHGNDLPTASEGVKSNALMRCCKDLGIASELWDPIWVDRFRKEHCCEVWVTYRNDRKRVWRRKDRTLEWPYKEEGVVEREQVAPVNNSTAASPGPGAPQRWTRQSAPSSTSTSRYGSATSAKKWSR